MTKARDLASNSTGSKPTLVDAKGDLLVGTAADTADRLAVGTNGHVLVANSSTTTGLEWQAASSGSMTSLFSGSLSGSSLDLQSISADYRDLLLILRNFQISGVNVLQFKVNNTTSIYRSTSSSAVGNLNADPELINGNALDSRDADNFMNLYLYDYANTTSNKIMTSRYVVGGEAGAGWWSIGEQHIAIQLASAINRVTVSVGSPNTFSAGTYVLYGVK